MSSTPTSMVQQASVLALAALLTACGGGGGGGSSSSAPAASPAPSPSTAAPAPVASTPAPAPSTTEPAAATSGVFISEVANNFYNNSVSWFELHNNSGKSINLSSYQLRSPAINPDPAVTSQTMVDSQTFQLPSLEVPAGAYVVISARATSDLKDSATNVYVADASNRVPYWQGSTGFVELLSGGQTVDFIRFGSSTATPTTTGNWTGPSVVAMDTNATSYNNALVRPAGNFRQTRSASDWIQVNFATPGGPNDVPAGVVDSDNDGIPDSAKVAGGTYAGMDLYAMGARKGQRDMFIHVDYMDSTDGGITPNADALTKVVQAFAKHNIAVHFDAGNLFASGISPAQHNLAGDVSHKRAFARCTLLVPPSQVTAGCNSAYSIKSANMDIRRKPIFRYLLLANSQQASGNASASGSAELIGDDFMVTLGNWNLKAGTLAQVNYQAATIMHELGHTLGLRHGGDENTNNKPNYFSVMNYFYQNTGLPSPTGAGVNQRYYYWQSNYQNQSFLGYSGANPYPEAKIDDGPLSATFKIDYSNGSSQALDERALQETLIIGRGADAGQYADWNLNGQSESNAQALDLDRNGMQSTLHDHDDWSNIIINSRRYQFANNSGVQKPGQRSLMSAVAATATAAFDPLTKPFQSTVEEAAPSASLLQRLSLAR
ncbi:hypothetical protein DZC30_07585 [Comamonas testosteroni]|uniref:LTD domain-containing protein n=1 Tax=Comamonas testosteroni TaxID=285 RepID=A0A373FNR6_COMTE|nr:lamin tail domain-containing protein [Comamonas testosteroni]RGE45793.1 hypothetical protein DZC30_07585 [Comamonas testosteroni]